MVGGKRFAVLLCAEDSDYVKKKYGGYFGVFVTMLGEEGEKWDVFRVAGGEFPDDDEIGLYDGFVITGSCNDAHGNDAWICRLLNLLKTLNSLKKKVLGICFGHQATNLLPCGMDVVAGSYDANLSGSLWKKEYSRVILGRLLGGKVGRAAAGWDIGITDVHLSSSSTLLGFLKMPAQLSLIEIHQDEVRDLPPKAEVLAWSDRTGIEMFRYGDHIMGIQGHPEYTKDILLHLIDLCVRRKLIEESYADEARAKVDDGEPDREAWRKLCTSFLKGRLS